MKGDVMNVRMLLSLLLCASFVAVNAVAHDGNCCSPVKTCHAKNCEECGCQNCDEDNCECAKTCHKCHRCE